ncbi:glutaredoxin family protein [Halobacillus sp. Marseille-Q1614]|uniref:glutaredoxin family protein n=1 Tax=Halobacillus sp. Marseille-Q1614 TaxID=2709134 RepID=UPI00156FBF56|nr:glutaredoxin family protein [Halobacillus sp. Marseille-Q1614]
MNEAVLYLKQGCGLCNEVKGLLEILQEEFEIHVTEVDIEGNKLLEEKYLLEIPVLDLNGEEMDYRSIDLFTLRERLH